MPNNPVRKFWVKANKPKTKCKPPDLLKKKTKKSNKTKLLFNDFGGSTFGKNTNQKVAPLTK